MMAFLENLYLLSLDAAPLLVFGLILAGLMKAWLPTAMLEKQLGGPGVGPVVKAALLGAPMPLCSCGVLPVALGLRRAGASKGATTSFLISTPETGVDSISLSYGLLGPVLTIARPVVAVINAIAAGLLTGWADHSAPVKQQEEQSCCCSSKKADAASKTSWKQGLSFTFGRLLEDMLPWLLVGMFFAAAVQTFVPEAWLAEWGRGPLAMIVMVLIGIPMYICASASTPIAAGLLLAGVSPGAVLVFMLAGPASNIAAVGMVYKELGQRALIAYLGTVSTLSIAAGLILDALIAQFGWEIAVAHGSHSAMLPQWIAIGSLLLLAVAAVKPLRQRSLDRLLAA
ncbi:SO_0444 family Cu/Zn efflux transporter [Spongiibacter tropicus]|uniref:SO_0444 family Cu/Zn efflux transporter n=1 Tax=Spongiibacter tropicus TaxID=454602 RepID=UPI003A991249